MTDIKKITVGVAMIAKNEKDFIARALESAKEADQIVVCDTGSTDNTIEIAKQYTQEVYSDFTWNDRFCDARNHVKSKMKTDWILSLDCDEYIHDFDAIRKAIVEAETKGIRAIDITQIAEGSGQINYFPRVFRNDPDIQWHGAAHNYISILGQRIGDIRLTYGYSSTHLVDKDRTMRILEKTVADKTAGPRELYYLGREYWYRQRYQDCTATLGKYIQVAYFPAEKADAFLMMARCYWEQKLGDDARDACVQALVVNPHFKEAAIFMSQIVQVGHASQWLKMADGADNRDVLFIRT